MDLLAGWKRSGYCADFRLADVGKEIIVCGWVQRRRDLGSLIFIDLRDRTGILQLAFDDATEEAVTEKAKTVRSEYVLAAKGVLRERSAKNADLPTGDIELAVKELRILGKSDTPPFEIIEKSMIFHMFFGSGTLRENPTSAKSAIHFTINQPRCHPASNPEIK